MVTTGVLAVAVVTLVTETVETPVAIIEQADEILEAGQLTMEAGVARERR